MRSILEVIPAELHDQLGPCFADRIKNGVIVTITSDPSPEVIRAGMLLNTKKKGKYTYYCILAPYMADEFPEYEWEHVTYGWEVDDARIANKRTTPWRSGYDDVAWDHNKPVGGS